MNQEVFFVAVLTALEQCRVPYMVAGSVAATLYGEPRMTNDMDVVVELTTDQVDALLAHFTGDDYYVPSAPFVREVVARTGIFNIIHVPSASKVDLIVRRRTDFAEREFSRRHRLPFTDASDASVATPEDVIVSKLLFRARGGSDKHVSDVVGVLRVSAGQIDEEHIE
ncbi:MAG: hypothetical protein JNM38_13210 [Acidobacteria bacterium]|nr:hypothetical protein [Acidobacteriota bacterium]